MPECTNVNGQRCSLIGMPTSLSSSETDTLPLQATYIDLLAGVFRRIFTFSNDTAYSSSPTALRASARSPKSSNAALSLDAKRVEYRAVTDITDLFVDYLVDIEVRSGVVQVLGD